MTEDQQTVRSQIAALLETQLLGVLSTHRDGQPYANLVAFSVKDDLSELYFATARSTRKFTNIAQDKRIAMLMDNRSNRMEDFHAAAAVTVIGEAYELQEEEKERKGKEYLVRHPYLEEFIHAPTTALLKVIISRYILVTRFQEVFELYLDE